MKQKFLLTLILTTLSLIILTLFYEIYYNKSINTFSTQTNKKNIFIDVGHGGFDPGFVTKNGGKEIYEKDVNLEIAKKLNYHLINANATVHINRTEDVSLAAKKKDDMWLRKLQVLSEDYDLSLSIHQNSYSNSSVRGAQVFYHKGSDNAKLLAESIQELLNKYINAKPKDAKANSTYYLFKNNYQPFVIIECGFLSNPTERNNLLNEDYQNKLSYIITRGVENYLQAINSDVQ